MPLEPASLGFHAAVGQTSTCGLPMDLQAIAIYLALSGVWPARPEAGRNLVLHDDQLRCRGAGIELFDESGAAFEHGALVDVALVGALARLDRRRLGQQKSGGEATAVRGI